MYGTISFTFLLIFPYSLYFSDVCAYIYLLAVCQGRIVIIKNVEAKPDCSYFKIFCVQLGYFSLYRFSSLIARLYEKRLTLFWTRGGKFAPSAGFLNIAQKPLGLGS